MKSHLYISCIMNVLPNNKCFSGDKLSCITTPRSLSSFSLYKWTEVLCSGMDEKKTWMLFGHPSEEFMKIKI